MATFATSLGTWAQKGRKVFYWKQRVLAKKQVGNFLSGFGSIQNEKVSLKG